MNDVDKPEPVITQPWETLARAGTPETIADWKSAIDRLLTHQCCAFHRNVEISSRYAAIYRALPAALKWAAMAAVASHHVRLALFPFRIDADRTGYVDIPHSLRRHKALFIDDINTIRQTNNAIFEDIFWVHVAYLTCEDGIGQLRSLLRTDDHYSAILAGFEAIDQGRRALDRGPASEQDRRAAEDLVWQGNVQLLNHEQRALVQPNFDGLSCTFARLISAGAVTSFDVRGLHHEVTYFTSFYVDSFTRVSSRGGGPRRWPRITRFDDRWRWLETSVVPRFRALDADTPLIEATLRRIVNDARDHASMPCVLPRVAPSDRERRIARVAAISRRLARPRHK